MPDIVESESILGCRFIRRLRDCCVISIVTVACTRLIFIMSAALSLSRRKNFASMCLRLSTRSLGFQEAEVEEGGRGKLHQYEWLG